MSTKIMIGNLPPGTNASELEEFLRESGAEVTVQIRENEGNDDVMAVATYDVDPKTAQVMVGRRKDWVFKGRKITVYAPLFGGS